MRKKCPIIFIKLGHIDCFLTAGLKRLFVAKNSLVITKHIFVAQYTDSKNIHKLLETESCQKLHLSIANTII